MVPLTRRWRSWRPRPAPRGGDGARLRSRGRRPGGGARPTPSSGWPTSIAIPTPRRCTSTPRPSSTGTGWAIPTEPPASSTGRWSSIRSWRRPGRRSPTWSRATCRRRPGGTRCCRRGPSATTSRCCWPPGSSPLPGAVRPDPHSREPHPRLARFVSDSGRAMTTDHQPPPITDGTPPRVVIVGAGFGGLAAARALANEPARVTVCDRLNYHLFQPLLYQVALASLSATDVAMPIRSILHERNIEVLLADVAGVDLGRRQVRMVEGDPVRYDYLILAAGARTNYYGHEDWAAYA